MRNEFEYWLKTNTPSGQAWKARLLSLAAAGAATALVGLSVVEMAGIGLPAGESAMQARAMAPAPAPATAPAQATAPLPARTVRHAKALPTVTVVGRREVGEPAAPGAPITTVALPPRAGTEDAAASSAVAADHLRN